VGHVVSNCALLEHAISYLEWQLTAFAWDAEHPADSQVERQIALRAERESWDKFATLETRLTRVTKAFENDFVSVRITQEAGLRDMRCQWEDLREETRRLGKRRNEVVHSFLSYASDHVFREFGRVWNERKIVVASDEQDLISALGNMAMTIASWTTALGRLLPFADDDQIIA
jgi:hypothetical protein